MDYSHKLAMSYYKTIATINDEHKIYLVQHQESNKIFVKKILDVYNIDIYSQLLQTPISGTPRIIDYYEENNQLTLIEEYISGTSLLEKINNQSLTEQSILDYISDICDILSALHNYKPAIIHRDIKPSNVIITNYNRAILLDFNAAKYYSATATEDTVLLGTQGYAAPEQYGFGSSSPQTDIYSLGIMLKEMLISANIPLAKYNRIINKCTKINPEDRYLSIAELKEKLSSLVNITSTPAKNTTSIRDYIIPGFRTQKPWKMIIAIPTYLLIFDLCLTLKIQTAFGIDLWLQRITCLTIMLSVIFITFNYRNIQRLMPLCNSNTRIIRYLGVIILDVIVVFLLMVILVAIESIFFL